MPDTYPNPRSQNDRAIVAYLRSVIPSSVIASDSILPANNSGFKTSVNLVVRTHRCRPDPQFIGSWRGHVSIDVQFPATVQAGNVNPEINRVAADALFGYALAALMRTENNQDLSKTAKVITDSGRALATTGTAQSQRNNADMLAYTCQLWQIGAGIDGGHPNDGNGTNQDAWAEVVDFECVFCNSNVD